jgi:formate hydrogenlyase subunit 6/NADH:ubiquinone oxidoreductase subunit I
MALREYFGAIGRAVVTLADGLSVTVSYLLRKPVTLQYPDRTEKPVVALLPARSRGFLEVDLDRCTACALCAKTCPIDCIAVVTGKDPATNARQLTGFEIDLGKCMFCGLCVEACPTEAIRHSHEFEGGMACVDNLRLQFVAAPRAPAKPPKKDDPGSAKPLGSIVRGCLPGAWCAPRPASVTPPAPPAAPPGDGGVA